ncbi:MAG: exo-alpha-sialidase, partial [Chloroflexi bacterium]
MKNSRHALLAAAGIASVVAAAIGLSPGVLGASTSGYTVANVGAYGGEPSIVSDNSGRLYISTPSGGTITYRSTNHGTSWTQVTTADPDSGDDCLATDQSGAVYLCNLNGSLDVVPLQAD